MKKLLVGIFIIVLCVSFIAHKNSEPGVIISNLMRKGDIRGKELKYRIYLFSVLPVGEAVLSPGKEVEYKGSRVYHLNATVKSSSYISKFFSGYAVLDSYLDLQERNPIEFKERLVVSGKNDIYKEVTYDQKKGIMTIAGVARQIYPDTQDPLSAMVNIRRIDFDKTKDFQMNINTNQKNYVLKATAQSKVVSISEIKYNTVLLEAEIKRRDKNPYHQTQATMVLLKEKGNLPLLIKIFAGGILINVRLIDIK